MAVSGDGLIVLGAPDVYVHDGKEWEADGDLDALQTRLREKKAEGRTVAVYKMRTQGRMIGERDARGLVETLVTAAGDWQSQVEWWKRRENELTKKGTECTPGEKEELRILQCGATPTDMALRDIRTADVSAKRAELKMKIHLQKEVVGKGGVTKKMGIWQGVVGLKWWAIEHPIGALAVRPYMRKVKEQRGKTDLDDLRAEAEGGEGGAWR